MSEREAVTTLIEGIRRMPVAMMTTLAGAELHTRPMHARETNEDGTLWFMTSLSSEKVEEIETDARVGLSYVDTKANFFAALSGRAEVHRDRAMIDRLWGEDARAYFPGGKDGPDIALIKVVVERGEYWQGPAGAPVRVESWAGGGGNEKVELPQ